MRCVSVVCDVGLYDREHVEYVYLSISMCVCLKTGAALRLAAGTRVIVVSHAMETQGKLEALQSEFVAAVVKWAERLWTQ